MPLVAKALSLRYLNTTVVQDFDITIPEGRITAIIGPNGSGKSTVLRGLARILRPASGSVLLDGRDIHEWPNRQLARRLSMLPQSPPQPEGLTVRGLVEHGRFPHRGLLRGDAKADREAIEWAIQLTGLTTFADRLLTSLSGGERQRAWIALALAQQSGLVLLDEPTTFLDLGHQLEVMELLTQLNEEQRLTVVMVLHDLNQAARYSHWVVALQKCAIWRAGPPADVLTTELLELVFGVDAVIVDDDGTPVCLPRRSSRHLS